MRGRKLFSSTYPLLILIFLSGCNARTPPSAAGNTKLFEHGTSQSYQLSTSVILNDPAQEKGKEVGYQIQTDVDLGVVWQNEKDKNDKLLEVEIKEPKLLIKSRKAPTPEGFDVHKSELEKSKNFPFLIHWKNGQVLNIYVDEREDTSIVNLKKGIASLFQVLDLETKETDASGHCTVTYKSIDPFSISKTKADCVPPTELNVEKTSDPVLSPKTTSSRTATYRISQDLSTLESISTIEHHDLKMLIRKEAGGSLTSTQLLTLISKNKKIKTLKPTALNTAVEEFEKTRQVKTTQKTLDLDLTPTKCDKDCLSLPKLIKENRNALLASSLGTLKSASAFVRLLSVARTSDKNDLAKAFKGTKNKEILPQLCDLAGAIQLPESHEIIMKIINFDSEGDLENSERYLWSLAAGFHPHESVIRDILKISQRQHPNEKLSETLVLTLAAMGNKFSKIPGKQKHPLLREITESLTGELELCKDEYCKIKYLRALKNLKCPRTIPVLIHHGLHGKKKTSVEAMEALRSFEPSNWSPEVIDAAQKIYFQAGKKYDSSSRTLALDILLESNPPREVLQELLLTLTEYDRVYEVKQYLAQRIKQISERNFEFSKMVQSIINEHSNLLKNYNTQALRGLTTAFGRSFASDEYRNGSLITVLEISKGLLKRGLVDVVIETPEKTTNLFRLGLFAGGLGAFVSSDEGTESNEVPEEEVATAGMELSVLGAHIRPFVFFNGQGELMGHVFSGTASEKTPAYQGVSFPKGGDITGCAQSYDLSSGCDQILIGNIKFFQALLLVVDHQERIPLQNGFIAQVEVFGGISFDLSGQIQISLWNRNAHSLVEKNAGISLQGQIKLDSSFVKSKIDFNTAAEVKLNLQSDLNFYSGTALCMQLSQPEVVIRQSFHKIESIPGGKHRLRRSKTIHFVNPGRTYALNKKNDEVCSSIFSD